MENFITKKSQKVKKLEKAFTKQIKKIKLENGWSAMIGKNSKNNDLILTKFSSKNDWWFHVRNVQGSHIILHNSDKNMIPNPNILLKVSKLAVKNSKAKFSSNVAVDYTKVKYVRKPKKAPAGFVIYNNFKTIICSSDK